jgi:superfamily I DNA/RNA helicase
VHGAKKFWEIKEVKEMLSLLRLTAFLGDVSALEVVIDTKAAPNIGEGVTDGPMHLSRGWSNGWSNERHCPAHNVGPKLQGKMRAAAQAENMNLAKLLLGDVDDSMLVLDPAKLDELVVKIKAENGMVQEALDILPGVAEFAFRLVHHMHSSNPMLSPLQISAAPLAKS